MQRPLTRGEILPRAAVVRYRRMIAGRYGTYAKSVTVFESDRPTTQKSTIFCRRRSMQVADDWTRVRYGRFTCGLNCRVRNATVSRVLDLCPIVAANGTIARNETREICDTWLEVPKKCLKLNEFLLPRRVNVRIDIRSCERRE